MAKKGLDEDRLKFFKGMGGSETSESDKTESDKIKPAISESDKSESDQIKSEISESDNRKSTNKRKRQTSKFPLPRSRAPSTIPKIRARKVDDSVLDQAIFAALKSPKVSIYSPFVAAVMKCNELTTIGYKSSADSRELLEKALEQAYPDVCEKVRRYMENK